MLLMITFEKCLIKLTYNIYKNKMNSEKGRQSKFETPKIALTNVNS